LYFTTGRVLRLFRIECVAGSARNVAVVSGSRAGGDGIGVFRWSRGVKVVSILFVRLALATVDSSIEPRIKGGRGSLAASLDGVLSQEPMWLVEIFCVFNETNPRCRRLFVRANSGCKRRGPVAVSM
jgi:type IV secretory pathway TrbD component